MTEPAGQAGHGGQSVAGNVLEEAVKQDVDDEDAHRGGAQQETPKQDVVGHLKELPRSLDAPGAEYAPDQTTQQRRKQDGQERRNQRCGLHHSGPVAAALGRPLNPPARLREAHESLPNGAGTAPLPVPDWLDHVIPRSLGPAPYVRR